ncbi:MAG: endonuclease III [Clostridia bacterium]|nr:endonuclease III [Clostridia bacterium]
MKFESKEIVEKLRKRYPDAKCSLDYKTPFEMVVAVMLSAQCTDERVNKTTPDIFKKYSTPEDFTEIDIEELEKLIHPCGFYKNKAKNIKACAKMIVERYNGEVPRSMEELMELPGVGRKSANVVMLEAFGEAKGIAVDTHCKRIANKIGLSGESEPEKIEQDLLKIFEKSDYKDINHLFIWHGRNTCTSRNPKFEECI